MTGGVAGRPLVLRFVRELAATARTSAMLALLLALAVAASEALGLLLLFPLLEAAGVHAGGGGAGSLAREAAARLRTAGISPTLAVLLTAYAAVMTVRAVLQRLYVVTSTRMREQFLLALRRRLCRAMLASRWERLVGGRAGELTHSLTDELERAADAPYHLLDLAAGALIGVVYLAAAVRLSATTTALAALCGAALLVMLRAKRRAARRAGETLDLEVTELFAGVAELVSGLKTVQGLGAEARSEELLARRGSAVATARARCETLFADARAVLDVGAVLVLAVAIYVAGGLLRLGPAPILVLLYVFARLTPRLAALQSAHQRFMLAMPAFARTVTSLDRCESSAEAAPGDESPLRLERAVTLHGVRYRYPEPSPAGGDPSDAATAGHALRPHALCDITMRIAAGRTTAVVGPSGAGKSTLADLVLGHLLPEQGRVEIDGEPLTADRVRSWRRQIGYVAQDTFLFNDTIAANLRWGRPNADLDDMRDALLRASAWSFVSSLPRGLETVVGERGVQISGGERQRLALARALIRRPTLLVLDEATSNVDAENERQIQHAVESLHGRMTVLVITHRLATVRDADVIYVVADGRLVEAGTWQALIAAGGRFAALCRAQGVAPLGQSDAPSPSAEAEPLALAAT